MKKNSGWSLMKRFAGIFAAWLVFFLVGTFLFGSFFLAPGHFYRLPLLLALFAAVFTCVLAELYDKLDALEKRIQALESDHPNE